MPVIWIVLTGDVRPEVIVIEFFLTPSVSAKNSTSDSLALPFSGAAESFTLSIPPNRPTTAVLLERGTALTEKMTELADCCIFNCSIYPGLFGSFAEICADGKLDVFFNLFG